MGVTDKLRSAWQRFGRSPLSGPLYIAKLFEKEVRYDERDERRRVERQQADDDS